MSEARVSPDLPSVVVPVYNALAETQACLAQLTRTLPGDCDVLLIDDASDDPRILPLLHQYVDRSNGQWRLLVQELNQGFVASANRGMRSCTGDVVLLNSDTLPSPGWLQALARALVSATQVATVTPWSNNGEIVSLPNFCQANPIPTRLDEIGPVLGATQPVYPELPTAVGFCMAISRAAIESVGEFDEALFGLGYGEENDFCMRARERGMRHLLCDDAYVAHVGGSSFQPRGLAPGEQSMQRLLSRHPGYLAMVQEFIAADPLAGRRQEVLAELQQAGVPLTD